MLNEIEYSIEDLHDAIFYTLAQEGLDCPKSINYIYSKICEENTCPELNNTLNRKMNKITFMANCYTIEQKNSKIYKYFQNDILFLILSRKTYEEIVESLIDKNLPYDNTNIINNTKIKFIGNEEQVFLNIIKSNPNPEIFNEPFNSSNDTMLHIICKNGYVNLLKKILENTNLIQTTELNNLKNILKINENGFEMLKILLNYEHKQIILKYDNKIIEMYNENEKLKRVNNTLQTNNKTLLQINEKNTLTFELILTCVFIVTIVYCAIIYFIYVYFNNNYNNLNNSNNFSNIDFDNLENFMYLSNLKNLNNIDNFNNINNFNNYAKSYDNNYSTHQTQHANNNNNNNNEYFENIYMQKCYNI